MVRMRQKQLGALRIQVQVLYDKRIILVFWVAV